MITLTLGVALWWFGHFQKRLAPGLRVRLGEGPARGLAALTILAGVVLMVIGYRAAPYSEVYALGAWTWHLNNLLMLVSVVLFGARSSKGRIGTLFRHPMLLGTIVWAVAHLLVNGDLASVILFGGIAVWALVSIFVINAASPDWERPDPAPVAADIRLLLISLAVCAAIIGIHWGLLGVRPFPG